MAKQESKGSIAIAVVTFDSPCFEYEEVQFNEQLFWNSKENIYHKKMRRSRRLIRKKGHETEKQAWKKCNAL